MDTLGKLFGSKDIVKMLRFFLLNPGAPFETATIQKRTRVSADVVRRELSMLLSVGFVKRRSFYKSVERKRGKKTISTRKRVPGYVLNDDFPYLSGLYELVAGPHTIGTKTILRRLRNAGRLKLLVLTGAFIQRFEGPLDLLIVGERFRTRALQSAIRDVESELGREIRYAVLSPHEFVYRLSMRDRLIRDTLDYAHETVLDRLGVEA